MVSSAALSSTTLAHKIHISNWILSGVIERAFQSKQLPNGNDHPEASLQIQVSALPTWRCAESVLGPQTAGPSEASRNFWLSFEVSSQRNGPSSDLDPCYIGGLFVFDNRRAQMDLSPPAIWECGTHSTTAQTSTYNLPNSSKCSWRAGGWQEFTTGWLNGLWCIQTSVNMMNYRYCTDCYWLFMCDKIH